MRLQQIFVVLVLFVCISQQLPFNPAIMDTQFVKKASVSIGIKGRILPSWLYDEHYNVAYYLYGPSPAFIVKYNTTANTVLEWRSIENVTPGCILRLWRDHVLLAVLVGESLTLYKFDRESLQTSTNHTIYFPKRDDSVFGKIISRDEDDQAIIIFSPVISGNGAVTLYFNLNTLTCESGATSFEGKLPYYYAGQRFGKDEFFLASTNEILEISKSAMKVISRKPVTDSIPVRYSYFALGNSFYEDESSFTIIKCEEVDQPIISTLDKATLTYTQTSIPIKLPVTGSRRCELKMLSSTTAILGYISMNTNTSELQLSRSHFTLINGKSTVTKTLSKTILVDSQDVIQKLHLFKDKLACVVIRYSASLRSNTFFHLLKDDLSSLLQLYPGQLSSTPIDMTALHINNAYYLIITCQEGSINMLKYDKESIKPEGAINLNQEIIDVVLDSKHGYLYYRTQDGIFVFSLYDFSVNRVADLTNKLYITRFVLCENDKIYFGYTQDGKVQIGVLSLLDRSLTAYDVSDATSYVSNLVVDDSFLYFDEDYNGVTTLYQMDMQDMKVVDQLVIDSANTVCNSKPFFVGQHMYKWISHLSQTTELIQIIKSKPLSIEKSFPKFVRFVPTSVVVDEYKDYVYMPVDTDVLRVKFNGDNKALVNDKMLNFDELNIGRGAVFTFSTICTVNRLLFSVASNGLVFTVNIEPFVTLQFIIGVCCVVGAFVLCFGCLFGLILVRTFRRIYIQDKIEGEMRALLLNDSLATDGSTGPTEQCDKKKDWIIPFESVKFEQRISEGSFGVVFRGLLQNTTPVAIKKLKKEDNIEDFESEVLILLQLRHPNILLFMGVCLKENYKFIVTEFCPGGSLEDLIHDRDHKKAKKLHSKVSFEKKCYLLIGIANGMTYLHSMEPPIIHRDLKPSNVLLDKMHTHAKVCDFGTSKLLASDATMTGRIGTICYMSPEIITNQRYTQSCDVYSFGVIMWELFFEKRPYCMSSNNSITAGSTSSSLTGSTDSLDQYAMNPWTLGMSVAQGLRPTIPEMDFTQSESEYIELMKKCWAQNPSERPTISNVSNVLVSLFDQKK
ncbi:serine/threonine-protein kinase/receptor [Acrasis kona]|uniref:Serine/threonine-protein kinase/receptor n=1 Tax=Acrasis kona TaxID=1008807 RepID=A0AAW2ZH77_9EUKA